MNFTDVQILTLIRANPGINLYQLKKTAEKDMPKWSWSRGKIHKSVQRLKKELKIEGRIKINGARSCQELFCRV